MTDSNSAPPAAPPEPPPVGAPTLSEGFFAWVTGFGVVRADGWLGGVCAGIAARLRIDAAIVRGIVAVTAVLGFPMLFLYAIAWALLPDTSGRIHLQELLKSRFDPAVVGIGILLIVSFVPAVSWIGAQLVPSWLWAGSSPVGFALAAVGLALAVVAIILIARASARTRTPEDSETAPRTASADASSSGAAGGSAGNGAPAAFSSAPPIFRAPAAAEGLDAEAMLAPAPEPVAPANGAADSEIAAWRAQHDAWRAHNDAWRRQQKDADRVAREQARAERAEAGAAFALEANERRRIARISRPRTSAAYVIAAVGAGLVVGSIAALVNASATPRFAGAIGLFAAALVLALAMILAGVLRRRSGFLAFATVLVLVGGGVAVAVPASAAYFGSMVGMSVSNATEQPLIVQRSGWLFIAVDPVQGAPSPIVVSKQDGDTVIQVRKGAALDLRGTFGTAKVHVERIGPPNTEVTSEPLASGEAEGLFALPDVPVQTRQTVMLDQQRGSVTIRLLADVIVDTAPTPTPTPTPVPTPEVTP